MKLSNLEVGSSHVAEFGPDAEQPGRVEFVVLDPAEADEDHAELVASLLKDSEPKQGEFDGWALVRWLAEGQSIAYHGPEGWCQAYAFDHSCGGDPFRIVVEAMVSYHLPDGADMVAIDAAIEEALGAKSLGSGGGLGARDLEFETELSDEEIVARCALVVKVCVTRAGQESARTREMQAVIDDWLKTKEKE